jgi:putative phosphoribosyl transferase
MFLNRVEAGRILAGHLRKYADRDDVLVLGVPRGGVPVAFEVASALHVPLDIFVLRKLGVPWHPELAFGAIATGGVQVLDTQIVESMGLSGPDIERVAAREKKELERREALYRGDKPPLKLKGQTVILVDDGIATGSSMQAAIGALRRLKPARLIVAIPVAPVPTCERLRAEVDELVCLDTPDPFYAIGEFYEDFSQVTDHAVCNLLLRAHSGALQEAC